MARSNLNRQVMLSMSAVTLVALAVMFFGWILYLYYYDWLVPNASENDESFWAPSDFVALAIFVAIGLMTAGVVGWRLSRRIVRPLEAVAEAARSIAAGDFGARAKVAEKGFGEAEALIGDFNTMASRLERAETELRFSNSAIAHELRTPLTILRGRLQGLSDGVFTPSADLYGTLMSHVDDLTRLVEDLRTLGLVSAGRLDLHLETTNLADEVEAVVSALEPELASAGATIERKLLPVEAEADRTRIRQALLAVLDNARRYAPHSTISLETLAVDSLGIIRCSDTGPGLPAGMHEKVFERFWRADDSRSRKSGGSGLGLSVVRAIARAHGGDAAARAAPGGGTTIEISLPLRAFQHSATAE